MGKEWINKHTMGGGGMVIFFTSFLSVYITVRAGLHCKMALYFTFTSVYLNKCIFSTFSFISFIYSGKWSDITKSCWEQRKRIILSGTFR